ncbi:MAG TPA: family 10 glycosylhydrolase, partial [Tepidisphaeraceae bacterium]|nr:family 10 glycosylhydrolase [Tepidisphaeraceae bacterium]
MIRSLWTILLLILSAGPASAAPAEVRAIYLVNHRTEKPLDLPISELRKIGFNTVVIDFDDNQFYEQQLIEAHRSGMLVIVNVNAYLGVKRESKVAADHPDWLTLAIETKPNSEYVLLNPFKDEVQAWVLGKLESAVFLEAIDGIRYSFDDFTSRNVGFDLYTKSLFEKETGQTVGTDPDGPAFVRWRMEKLTEFSLRIVSSLRQNHPDLILSVQVPVMSIDFPKIESSPPRLLDWESWTKWCECGGKHWDELIPTWHYATTKEAALERMSVSSKALGSAGMFVTVPVANAMIDPIPVLQESRRLSFAGHFVFGISKWQAPAFRDFYDLQANGFVHNPLKPSNWREPSIPATREGDVFVADLKDGNRYHVIVRKNGDWKDIGSFDLKPGRNTFLQDGEALELL